MSTRVELQALVGRDGRVRQVRVVPYDVRRDILTRGMRASFDSAAVRAVRAWTFRPATREGEPVQAWFRLEVPFEDPAHGGNEAKPPPPPVREGDTGARGAPAVTVAAESSRSGSTVVLVGAGDIGGGRSAAATARLLDAIPGTVFTAGDNAYPIGSTSDFEEYDRHWGRHKGRTRPSPGNHDYGTSGAEPYYAYFGANAGPAGRGYYSYDLGDWHIVSLNSNIDMSAGSPQERWLREDLSATDKDCVLAYWHHPRFNAGRHGNSTETQGLWDALYEAGAEVVVVGHDHNYQRFAPQTPSGRHDPERGIRQFVAGTGGRSHYRIKKSMPNLEVSNTSTHGVLKFTLGPGTYEWEFVPVQSGTWTDSGRGECHR
jgi:hypothetical protein